MMRGGIVPIHQQGAITGVEIKSDQPARISLLVDQRDGRLDAQQALIDFVADGADWPR